MAIPQISVFSDCGSMGLIMRIPYDYACKMISSSPDCKEKTEVIKWLKRQPSPMLKKKMKEYNII